MGADVALAYATSPKYSVDASGPQLVQADAHPAEGCHIELTVIEFAGRPWRIFLLEGFIWIGGIDGPDLLKTAARFFGDGRPPLHLDVEQPCSYPAWLARRVGRATLGIHLSSEGPDR
jgi:hypothetical protein